MSVVTQEIAAVGAHLNEVYPMLPFTPVRGTGVWLENAAGRRVLDLYGGHAVAALGYGHRDLSDTILSQAEAPASSGLTAEDLFSLFRLAPPNRAAA